MTIFKRSKPFKTGVQSCIVIVFLLFAAELPVSCSKAVPPLPPNVSGVSDGEVYGAAVLIDIRNPQENVSYAATIDGQPFELGTFYGQEGKHTLTVTAADKKGMLSSRTTLEFEIDKVPPPQPEITGVEENKTYNSAVRVFVLEEKGITYTASIDGEEYILGTEFDQEGRHELTVYALKKRNGLAAEKTVSFSIDKESYTADEISYFQEIAFGSEFGGKSGTISKWQDDILIQVTGQATREDLDNLSRVVSELNDLIDTLEITILDEEGNAEPPGVSDKSDSKAEQKQPNLTVHFIPNAEFVEHTSEKNALENWGLFFYYKDSEGVIYQAKVLIASDKANAGERAHLIREELTQTLGLAQDSERYRDSIFYQGWTTTHEFSEMDKRLITMLYNKNVYPNMTEKDAVAYFESRQANGNERFQVFPTDQSYKNPSFLQFVKELQDSIAHRDLNYILQHVDEDFTAEPLEGKGVEPFKKYFMLEYNPEQSSLWRILGEALELGGVFKDPALSVYEAPYTKDRFPKQLDPNACKAATRPDIEVHEYPDVQSAVVDTLRYDAVKVLQPLPPSELPEDIPMEEVFKWEYIETCNGKKGYVPIEKLRSPAADIFTFRNKKNHWVISAVSNR